MPRRLALTLLALLLALPATGCMRSTRARTAHFSGYLTYYARLDRGERHEAVFQWQRRTTDWSRYDNLIIEPIALWPGADDARPLSTSERRALQTRFDSRLRAALADDFNIVRRPEPGTARLNICVTRITPRRPLLDTASTVSPLGLATSSAAWGVTGKAPFTGEITIEYRITDANTGLHLSEGVDRRTGGKWLIKGLDEWADANNAMDDIIANLRYRLCVRRGGDCEPPLQP